jgi:hypothetical protein
MGKDNTKIGNNYVRFFNGKKGEYEFYDFGPSKKEERLEEKICKYYLEGKCVFGNKCKNKHPHEQINCNGNCWGSKKSYGICTCDSENKDICLHNKNGFCKYGDKCKKKHL